MPQEIGWSVEAKLLYQIKELTKRLAGRTYIAVFPNFAAFPIPGIPGTLYVDEATGDIYVWNGASYVLLSSGITALNTLVSAAQFLVTGSAGTDFNISSVGTTHTFNIPTASATNRGLLSSADWSAFNSKIGGTGASGQVAFFNGTSIVTGDNGLFWDNTNKRLGILNAAPLAALHVGNRNSTGSTDPLILASRTINSGTGNSRGFSDSTNYARSGGTSYASYDARVDITGTNNFGHYAAFQSGPTLNFTGTITDVFNYVSSPTYTAGTITNSYGTYVQNPVKTGATLTNNYGHYFPSVFNAGTNNWVWYNASTERSYSAGDTISRRFFAGSNSVASPSAQFHADGTGDIKLRLQQSGFNYWDFTSVSGTTYATIADVSGTYVTFFNLGNVALGTTTNNGYKLDVQGSLRNTTSAYFATSSGNVGVGTTSANAKLDVLSDISTMASFSGPTGTDIVRFVNTGSNANSQALQMEFRFNSTAAALYNGALIYALKDAGVNTTNLQFHTTPAASTTPVERMRIDGSGNVGIGTTSPQKTLSVVGGFSFGDQAASPQSEFSIYHNAANATFTLRNATASQNAGFNIRSNSGTLALTMFGTTENSQGYQGLGTLNIGANDFTIFSITTGSTPIARFFTGGNVAIGTNTNNGYKLDVQGNLRNTTDAYFATSSGSVGVGTTSPTNKLMVIAGNSSGFNISYDTSGNNRTGIFAWTNASSGGGIGGGVEQTSDFVYTARSTSASYLSFGSGNIGFTGNTGLTAGSTFTPTTRLLIWGGTGNISIGNTNNTYNLDVSGTLRNTTDAYFATSSGGVAINATSVTSGFKLDVVGDTRITGLLLGGANSIKNFVNLFGRTSDSLLHVAGNDLYAGDVYINYNGGRTYISANGTGNLYFGTGSIGTSATKTMVIGSGTAPSTSPADAFQMYSNDITAGNAAPHFRTEGGAVIKLYQQTTAVTSAAFVANAGTAVNDASTFGGYTLGQVIKALQNLGVLQ